MKIRVKKLKNAVNLPKYATAGSSGLDLYAAIEKPIILLPKQRCNIPTGIAVEIPFGYEGQIRPRSGLAVKHGITVLNTPGTIDSDYRGEIKVVLINLGKEKFVIYRGDRIAQLVFTPIVKVEFEEVEELSPTERGEEGFGSTGI